jgi:hypothetical protein
MDHLQAGAVAAADVYSEVKELVSKNHHHHHHHHHGDIDEPSSTVFYSPSRNDQQQQLLHKVDDLLLPASARHIRFLSCTRCRLYSCCCCCFFFSFHRVVLNTCLSVGGAHCIAWLVYV